jgi:hypothetical protein
MIVRASLRPGSSSSSPASSAPSEDAHERIAAQLADLIHEDFLQSCRGETGG